MSKRTYTFEMKCLRCGLEFDLTGTRESPPPKVNCDDCLKDDLPIEMTTTRVWVNNGASQ